MSYLEMFVDLLIPDTVAITTRKALKKMGYHAVINIKRSDYYKFTMEEGKDIVEKLGKVDILVNANKHKFSTKLEKEDDCIFVLVKDDDNPGKSILATLRDRLGFKGISNVEKGVLWKIYLDIQDEKQAKMLAEEITNQLLANKHYQTYEVL